MDGGERDGWRGEGWMEGRGVLFSFYIFSSKMLKSIEPCNVRFKLFSQECFENAKYCVGVARKIGAPVYALPEDISEVSERGRGRGVIGETIFHVSLLFR